MSETVDVLQPTSDERTMGALAHFFGILGSLIIYVLQKDKSRFVRFQAAQALAFDFIVMLVMFVSFFCLFGVMVVSMFGTMFIGLNSSAQSNDLRWFMIFPVILPTLMVTCIFPFSLALLVVRIVAAISVLNGNYFRYPWLGTKVEQFLRD